MYVGRSEGIIGIDDAWSLNFNLHVGRILGLGDLIVCYFHHPIHYFHSKGAISDGYLLHLQKIPSKENINL